MIKSIFIDVDGTITDGRIFYSSNGEELKCFNVKEGLGIKLAIKSGINVFIITGRKSSIVEKRAKELGIKKVYQNIIDKEKKIKEIASEQGINFDECCYIGDDLNDYYAMKLCGYKMCPADAAKEIREMSDFVSQNRCDNGAVREIIEYIITKINGKDIIDLI